VEKRFDANTDGFEELSKYRALVEDWLIHTCTTSTLMDVVYVDADHNAHSALMDGALSWKLLKPGGILIFDDYEWSNKDSLHPWKIPPKPGIDAFLTCWAPQLELLHKGWQVIVQKI
jgi:hypothetical protein